MERREICIVMMSYNQKQITQRALEKIYQQIPDCVTELVVVDNASTDGLAEWLLTQKLNYIICDNGIEHYGEILNTVIQEFAGDKDILLLSPNAWILPDTVKNMQQVLYSGEHVGAVYTDFLSMDCPREEGYEKSVKYALEHSSGKRVRTFSYASYAFMMRADYLRELVSFDNALFLPENILLDAALRGSVSGWAYYLAENAYVYLADNYDALSRAYKIKFGSFVDRNCLKEKWDMNYFNCTPNTNLLNLMEEDEKRRINVLEIGCDLGANLLEISNRYPNAGLYGLEINAASAKIAGAFANVKIGNIEERMLPFEEEIQFDYIIFGDVLEHLRSPGEVLAYCSKRLKKDGHILASIPNLMHFSVVRGLLDGNFTYTDTGLLDKTHIHMFTYKEIVKMFEGQGYDIERVTYIEVPSTSEDRDFVTGLMALSGEDVKEFMYNAFQYIISAKKQADF